MAKNTHLEHLEDDILNDGTKGGKNAISFLRELGEMLSEKPNTMMITTKWDGAPAIVCGIDPETEQFFVGTKSVFNKTNPKVIYNESDIAFHDYQGELAKKLKLCLEFLPKLGIKGVIQGDLMFTDDKETQVIDGIKYLTFQPNTIVYAVPTDSGLGKIMDKAKVGVVWHTTYTGNTLADMKASFGVNISKFTKTPSVWMDDATYKDTSGTATFNQKETEFVTKILSDTGKTFQRISGPMLRKFIQLQESFTGVLAGASLKTYNNSKVRVGETIKNPKAHAKGYEKWVEMTIQKQIDKAKSVKGKQKYTNLQRELVREVRKHTMNLGQVITFQNLLVDAKMQIVKKLNSVKGLTDTFIRTPNGYKVVNPEGYVAIDRVSGGAVKLVDRMEFSFNNFTAIKAWDK